MRCEIESDSRPERPREWKIKARLDSKPDIDVVLAELVGTAHELLRRFHAEGAEELTDSLDQGHFDASAIPTPHAVAAQIDSALARARIEVPDQSAQLEHSGASVALRLGIRCAVIQVASCPEDPSQTANIVFKCSRHYPELTAFQLHYIETTYRLMTSDNAAERYRGARMCSSKDGIRPYPFEGSPPDKGTELAIDSIYRTEFEYWGSAPDLAALLGEEAADEINWIPGIRVVDPAPDAAEDIANMLNGGRRIFANRLESDMSRANPHWFTQLECVLLHDGSMKVTLRNGIGGTLRAFIELDRLEHETYPASIIVPLFQVFARSTGSMWTEVLGYVESLTEQSASDVELRVTDPSYENIPPFEDRVGALMLGKCAKMSAFVTASVPPWKHHSLPFPGARSSALLAEICRYSQGGP